MRHRSLLLVCRCYYRLVHRPADVEHSKLHRFGLYDQQIIEICRDSEDAHSYFRGLITEIGLPTARLPCPQSACKRGLIRNNFYTLYDKRCSGLTNHSKVPLRLAAMLGFGLAFFSLLVAVIYFIYNLVLWQNFVVCMAPVVIGLFLFCFVQLFFIRVLGEYIGAIHTQVLRQPHVLEKERLNFELAPYLPRLVETKRLVAKAPAL